MFTYLLSPENGTTTNFMIALTVTDDVITAYVQYPSLLSRLFRNMPIIKNFLPYDNVGTFVYCLNKYANDMVASGLNISNLHRDDKEHDKAHSTDKDEIHVEHYHIKHRVKITPDILKKFLIELEQCSPLKELANKEIIFNKAATKKIIHEFNRYIARQRHERRSTAGNNPEYIYSKLKSLPTIAQHEKCLAFPNATGCTGDNPYSPDHLRLPTVNSQLEMTAQNSSYEFAGGFVLATFALGLFALCRRKPAEKTKQYQHENDEIVKSFEKRRAN